MKQDITKTSTWYKNNGSKKNSKGEVRCREANGYITYSCISETVNLYYPPLVFNVTTMYYCYMISPNRKTNDGIKKNNKSKVREPRSK